MAALILPLTSFIVFVAAPHQFGVIVIFFLGFLMVTCGQFSHPVGQIMTLLSPLVCCRRTSKATRLVSIPLEMFILRLFPLEIRAFSVFAV